MSDRQSLQHLLLGTAVKLTAMLNVELTGGDTIKIDIKNASNQLVVTSANMTLEASKVYSYTWQSAVTDVEGEYVATISITKDSYTTVKQEFFVLLKQSYT